MAPVCVFRSRGAQGGQRIARLGNAGKDLSRGTSGYVAFRSAKVAGLDVSRCFRGAKGDNRDKTSVARRGYTLIELLIVLMVLVSIAAFSWPALRGAAEKSELQEAARTVNKEIARVRLAAIESGDARQFRYQPGGKRFEVGPLESAIDPAAADMAAAIGVPIETAEEFELPYEIRFATPDPAAEATGMTEEDITRAAIAAPTGGDWSKPIIFEPTGRCANSRVKLLTSTGRSVEIKIRGLTGSAAIGPVRREEESP